MITEQCYFTRGSQSRNTLILKKWMCKQGSLSTSFFLPCCYEGAAIKEVTFQANPAHSLVRFYSKFSGRLNLVSIYLIRNSL